jgi:hypothetical protein
MKQHCGSGQKVDLFVFQELEIFVKIIVLDCKNNLQALFD